jgi:hypothetical protein
MITKVTQSTGVARCINTEGTKELSLGKLYDILGTYTSPYLHFITIYSDEGNRRNYGASRFNIQPSIPLKKDFK